MLAPIVDHAVTAPRLREGAIGLVELSPLCSSVRKPRTYIDRNIPQHRLTEQRHTPFGRLADSFRLYRFL